MWLPSSLLVWLHRFFSADQLRPAELPLVPALFTSMKCSVMLCLMYNTSAELHESSHFWFSFSAGNEGSIQLWASWGSRSSPHKLRRSPGVFLQMTKIFLLEYDRMPLCVLIYYATNQSKFWETNSLISKTWSLFNFLREDNDREKRVSLPHLKSC